MTKKATKRSKSAPVHRYFVPDHGTVEAATPDEAIERVKAIQQEDGDGK